MRGEPAILFIVENADKNLMDKRVMIDDLLEKHNTPVFMLSMAQVARGAVKTDDEGVLWYGKYEIFLVYY